MARSVYDRSQPTFQPIVKRYDLTDDERRRLETHPLLQDYPHADYLSIRERCRCYFMRWYWRNGDER